MLLTIITCCKDDYLNLEQTITSYDILENYSDIVEVQIRDATATPDDIRKIIPGVRKLKNLSIVTEPDRGLYDGMNRAIESSNGAYVAIINAGDCLLEGFEVIMCDMRKKLSEGLEGPDIYTCPVVTWKNKVIRPAPDFSSFIHQGLVYKKDLHLRYGNYLVCPGFSASDYLFFFGQVDNKSVTVDLVDEPVAYYDRPGISSSFIHMAQAILIFATKTKMKPFQLMAKLSYSLTRFYLAKIVNYFYK